MKNRFRKLAIIVGVGFILLNVIAIFHAYNFTHTKIGLEKPRTARRIEYSRETQNIAIGNQQPTSAQ